MRIGLIAMSGVRVRTKELAELGVTLPGFVNRGRVIASLPSLGLLTVAALTPPDVEVVYREIQDVHPEDALERFDLVAISSFTAQIDEAYALADRYRAAGVPVVLGGLHVTLMPDEAAAHADSIVVNGAEGAWPRLVEDFRKGCLKPRYEGLRAGVFRAPDYVVPRFDLLRGRPYNRITVQTSRGCPLHCEFCGEPADHVVVPAEAGGVGAGGNPRGAGRHRTSVLRVGRRQYLPQQNLGEGIPARPGTDGTELVHGDGHLGGGRRRVAPPARREWVPPDPGRPGKSDRRWLGGHRSRELEATPV